MMARTDPWWYPAPQEASPPPVPGEPYGPPSPTPAGPPPVPGVPYGPPSPWTAPFNGGTPAPLPWWMNAINRAAGMVVGAMFPSNGGSGTGSGYGAGTGANPYALPPATGSGGGGGYRGGGGGGGGYVSDPWFGIPTQYRTGFENVFGKTWYTPEHGGDNQIKSDYQTVANAYGNYAQRWPDPDAWTPFLNGFAGWAKNLGRPVLPGDMADYADVTMRRLPEAPQVSPLKMAEI